MCNQYLLSDLRLQTRGSKAGAVLAPSGAVLAALEPPRPRATQRRGALEQRWGSGTEVGLWAAPPRPGGAFRAPRGPCGNTIGLGATKRRPCRYRARAGRCAATWAGGGATTRAWTRRTWWSTAEAPPSRATRAGGKSCSCKSCALELFGRVEAGGNQAAGVAPHFGDGVRAPWSYNTTFRYDSL